MKDPDAVLGKFTKEVEEEDGSKRVVPVMSEELKDTLVKNIRRRMTPQPLKLRADVELTCFTYD